MSDNEDIYSSDDDVSDDEEKDVIFITNNKEIKEKKFSWTTLLMYLFILTGAILFIITASLDPRESSNLYIVAGALIGFAFVAMIYINL